MSILAYWAITWVAIKTCSQVMELLAPINTTEVQIYIHARSELQQVSIFFSTEQ